MSDYLKIPQAALAYGISRATLYRLSERGELPIRKFGRASRIARADLDAWATSRPLLHSTTEAGQ